MAKHDSAISGMDQRLWLAAFGKHPGWNDHLDDIGLETDRLVSIKRTLYVDGIGGVIGAGTWESMDEASRDEGFSHSFLWRQPDGLVVGRMWSSSDGKGRTKYPMIVCAQCRSLPLSSVGGPVLSRLRRLEDACRSAGSAAEVISAVDRMREELRELASYTPAVTRERVQGEGAASRLAGAEEMGPDGQGLRRVLYQMEREMAAYLRPERSATGSRSRTMEVRAQHMRVPRVFETEAEAWSVWARVLLSRVDQLAPLMLIARDDRPWLDVIVGEPGPSQLICLQATPEAFPYTTEIPFSVDEETDRRAAELVEESRAGETEELDPGFVDAPADRLAPFLRPKRKNRDAGPSTRRQVTLAVWVAAAVLVIAVLLAVVLLNRPVASQTSETGAEQSEVGEGEDLGGGPIAPDGHESRRAGGSEPRAGPPGERVERFRRWCELEDDWYLPFISALDRETAARDPHLASTLLARIDDAMSSGIELDPLDIVPGRHRSRNALAEDPPDLVRTDAFAEKTDQALAHIDACRGAISVSRWPAHADLAEIIDGLRRAGDEPPPTLVRIREDLLSENGDRAARGLHTLVGLGQGLSELADTLARREEIIGALPRLGADEPAAWYRSIAIAPPVDAHEPEWVEAAIGRLSDLLTLGDRLIVAAEADLPKADPALLDEMTRGVDGTPEEKLEKWLANVSDPAVRPLDPADDPRAGLADPQASGEPRLAAVDNGGVDARELAGRIDEWRREAALLADLAWTEANRDRIERDAARLNAERMEIDDRLDALERTRRVEAGAFVSGLRSEDSISETGSEAIDRAWRAAREELLRRFAESRDLAELSRGVEDVTDRLRSVEGAMPRFGFDASPLGPAKAPALERIESRREALIEEAARGGEGTLERVAETYAIWGHGVGEAIEAYAGLTRALRSWKGLDEPAGGSTLRLMLEVWNTSWLARELGKGSADGRVRVLSEHVLSGDRASLASVLHDQTAAPEVVYAAWLSLEDARPAWPADLGELRIDADVRGRLDREAAALGRGRAAEVGNRLSDVWTRRWTRVAEKADGWEAFRSIAAMAEGIELQRLPARIGYHLSVVRLGRRIEDGGPLASAARELTARWRGAGLGNDAEAWLRSVDSLLKGAGEEEIAYHEVGPGRVGWVVEPYQGGRRLVYSWLRGSEPAVRLAFRLVESPETGAFYMTETEVPASMLFEFALSDDKAGRVLPTLDPDWAPLEDPRPGPRVWTWRRDRGEDRGIRSCRRWTSRSQGDEADYYAPRLIDDVERPTPNHPLQRVSPAAAAVIAGLVGCRLPTEGEWGAAYASVGSPGASDEWNLRDRSFDAQRTHVESRPGSSVRRWPDEGAFSPSENAVRRGPGAESHPWSDGRLWFEEVDSGRDRPFRHLIGNVGEYVLRDGSLHGLMTDRFDATTPEIIQTTRREPAAFAVIGASALSPPGRPVSSAVPMEFDGRPGGYTDVGFRLVFTPRGDASSAVGVGELLRDAPFLRGPVPDNP